MHAVSLASYSDFLSNYSPASIQCFCFLLCSLERAITINYFFSLLFQTSGLQGPRLGKRPHDLLTAGTSNGERSWGYGGRQGHRKLGESRGLGKIEVRLCKQEMRKTS